MQNTTKNGEKFQVPENAETKKNKTFENSQMPQNGPEKKAKQCRKMQKNATKIKIKKGRKRKKGFDFPPVRCLGKSCTWKLNRETADIKW